MKRLVEGIVVCAVLLMGAAAAEAADPLVGKWQATKMERQGETREIPPEMQMVAEFKPGGKFISSLSIQGKSQKKAGTWKVKGKKLTTTVDKRTETMVYTVSGGKLVLTKEGSGEKLHLKRMK